MSMLSTLCIIGKLECLDLQIVPCHSMNEASVVGTIIGGGETQTLLAV